MALRHLHLLLDLARDHFYESFQVRLSPEVKHPEKASDARQFIPLTAVKEESEEGEIQ